MIASMFNLEQRLAELRPTERELASARQLRKAATPAMRPARSAGETAVTGDDVARGWFGGTAIGNHLSRLAAV